MNRITALFRNTPRKVLSVYYTAGFPNLHDTLPIARALQAGGADMIEIGIPFSDPVADGATIQHSNEKALHNGMTLRLLFEQLHSMRTILTLPILLMGYLNTILRFGVEAFCQRCCDVGVDGVIIPDMPPEFFAKNYAEVFTRYGIVVVFLLAPQTPPERMQYIASVSQGFVYVVSSFGTTGGRVERKAVAKTLQYVEKQQLVLPHLAGFGIADAACFATACTYANGAIVGSAFVRFLDSLPEGCTIQHMVREFLAPFVERCTCNTKGAGERKVYT